MNTKTLNIATTLLLVLMLGLQSCMDKKGKNTNGNETNEEKEQDTKQDNGEFLKQTISYDYAKKLEAEFVNTRGKIINKYLDFNEGEEDTREFLFDIKALKAYIAYVEREGKKLGYNNLGIRIYNGAYPNTKGYPDPGYSTVFLVPTGNKIKSKGSLLSFSTTAAGDENITELMFYNYGHAGKPPKDLR